MIFVNDLNPVLLEAGPLEIRWYGALFAVGILLNYLLLRWIFKREKMSLVDLDSLILWLFVGMVVGARLGHVVFYNADYFLSRPVEILRVWNGGLSSHGAAIGVFAAYLLWGAVRKIDFRKYVDLLVVGMPLTAGFVRIGNFFNSEIVGKPTGSDWGVVFARLGEDFPRYPTQLFESLLSFLIFGVLLFGYLKFYKKLPPLFLMFLFIALYFSTRFVVEFWKGRQVLMNFPLSMGQVLSVVPVMIAVVGFWWILAKEERSR